VASDILLIVSEWLRLVFLGHCDVCGLFFVLEKKKMKGENWVIQNDK
jgi:hypothetical protein